MTRAVIHRARPPAPASTAAGAGGRRRTRRPRAERGRRSGEPARHGSAEVCTNTERGHGLLMVGVGL
ncbi:hypothetical protein TOK_1652 [Pseudonocardia sp. N23]|nr:hypothetical protein TOK_1652 [Pseudonocardia sp. N23]